MKDKLIAELREWRAERPDLSKKTWDLIAWKNAHDAKFNEILSRHEAEQGDGLREIRKRIEKFMEGLSQDNNAYRFGLAVLDEVDAIERTPTKDTEPLAVLADRKGVYITRQKHHNGYVWYINFDAPPTIKLTDEQFDGLMTRYEGETYALAEAKAREYLNGLEDKGGKS